MAHYWFLNLGIQCLVWYTCVQFTQKLLFCLLQVTLQDYIFWLVFLLHDGTSWWFLTIACKGKWDVAFITKIINCPSRNCFSFYHCSAMLGTSNSLLTYSSIIDCLLFIIKFIYLAGIFVFLIATFRTLRILCIIVIKYSLNWWMHKMGPNIILFN